MPLRFLTFFIACVVLMVPLVVLRRAHAFSTRSGQSNVTVVRDVEFTKAKVEAGELSLKLDVYKPAGQGPFPAMILIHGGGFQGGDKGGNMGQLGRYLADRGIACFDIQYRLQRDKPSTKGMTPMQRAISAAVEDADSALRWVAKNANVYSIDTKRIGIGGSSAGSITALLVTYGTERSTVPVKCVVDLWGGMYLQVNQMKKGDPPFLLVHGSDDPTVPFSLGEALMKRADEVGVRYEKYVREGGGHGMALKSKVGDVTLDEFIYRFLVKELVGKS